MRLAVYIAIFLLGTGTAAAEEQTAQQRPDLRIGPDAGVSVGPILGYSGALRYERRFGERWFVTGRAIYTRGVVILSEDNGFDAVTLQIGARRYTRAEWGYFVIEAGLASVRDREHLDPFDDVTIPAEWRFLPSVQTGFGAKLGRLDVSLTGWFPYLGVALQLGIDFVAL